VSKQDFLLSVNSSGGEALVVGSYDRAKSEVERISLTDLHEIADLLGMDCRTAGEKLFHVVFSRSILRLFGRYSNDGRIVVELPKPADEASQQLHRLPWETLHDGTMYLAVHRNTPVIRRVPGDLIKPTQPEWPLRILFTTASPTGCAPLALQAEEDQIRNALRKFGNNATLTVKRNITYEELAEEYRKARDRGAGFHIWHHAGHGTVDDELAEFDSRDVYPRGPAQVKGFELLLHSADEQGEGIGEDRLGEMIADNPSLGLVTLNVCFGGSPAGLAPRLATLQVANIVAFRRPVGDQDAVQFAGAFYSHLADSSLEQAIVRCRQSMPALLANLVQYSRTEACLELEQPDPASMASATSSGPRSGFSSSKLSARKLSGILIQEAEGLELEFRSGGGPDGGS